jgi:hypothetical protein
LSILALNPEELNST